MNLYSHHKITELRKYILINKSGRLRPLVRADGALSAVLVVSAGVAEADGRARVVAVGRDEVLLQLEPRPLVPAARRRVVAVRVLRHLVHVALQPQVVHILKPAEVNS